MKYKNVIIFITLFLFIYKKETLAAEVKVYCSDRNKNWHWLDNGNEKVTGKWNAKYKNQSTYFIYFIIDNGISEVDRLKAKCISEFGKDFLYAQPFLPHSGIWIPFAINDDQFIDGHVTNIRVNPTFIRFG